MLPIGALYYAVLRYSVDIPYTDDFEIILASLMGFLDSETLIEKLGVLFSQHAEHRPVFARTLTVVFYFLRGNIDFRLLIYIGSLGGFALMTFLYLSTERGENRLLLFVPAVFIFFQPQYWESIVQASGALSNIPGIFFSLLSISLAASPGRKHLFLSLAFAAAAVFTYGAGLLALPVGAFLIALQRRYGDLRVFLAAMAAVFAIYFAGYTHPSVNPGVAMSLASPAEAAKFFFLFLGAPMAITDKFPAIYAFGAASTGTFILLTVNRYYKKNTVIYASLVFLFVVVLAITANRAGFGLLQALSPRYRFIPALIFALEFIGILELAGREKAKKVFPLFLAASVLFNAYSFVKEYRSIEAQRVLLARWAIVYRIKGYGLAYTEQVRADSLIAESARRKIYFLPDIKTLMEWSGFR